MNQLAHFSDDEIETRLKTLILKERQLLHVILEHIKEVDTRKLYLERAYSSLYEYLTKELKYSGSAAMRRIEAARLLREVPIISEKIQEGVLNLSQIGELSRALKEKEKSTGEKVSTLQKQELLEKISSKTTFETQKELSVSLDITPKDIETKRLQKDDSVLLEITLSKEQYALFLQCQNLASHTIGQNNQNADMASTLEVLMKHYAKSKTQFTTASAAEKRQNKSLTPRTRKFILQRDQCCQYVDAKTGRICGSRYLLEVDHRTSRWASGDHSPKNLQALCGNHNKLKYRQESYIR